MDKFCRYLILSVQTNLNSINPIINSMLGIKSGCILKLSAKFPVKNKIPALVMPQAGQGTPKSIIVGQILLKK